MRKLNAIDAISPAWERTSRLLLAPRRWTHLLKIATIAILAQMGGCNLGFNLPNQALGHATRGIPHQPSLHLIILAIAFALTFGVAIWLLVFYLTSRLQFVLFDIVLRGDTTVAPIWKQYGPITWRWVGLRVAFFATALLSIAPIAAPIILLFIHAVSTGDPNLSGHAFATFFGSVLAFIAVVFAFVLVIAAADILLHDFGLPSLALEQTSISETVARVLRLLRAEPLQILLYLVMRFVLGLAIGIAADIAFALAALIALIPLGGLGALLWFTLGHNSLPGKIVAVLGCVLLGLLFLALAGIAAFMLFGSVVTFFQAYALFFLGGRYPLLGEYLEPPPIPPPPPPGDFSHV